VNAAQGGEVLCQAVQFHAAEIELAVIRIDIGML
jgi:hypothetical protein